MRRAIPVALMLACFGGSLPAADIEITPMYGYRWGGEVKAGSSELFTEDVEIDDSAAYGLVLGIRPTAGVTIELSANRQESRFIVNDSLFGGSSVLFDVDTTYYHVGAGYSWVLGAGDYEPFVTGSLGMAQLDPDAPGVDSASEFSASVGGGIKVWANERVGFRFELRGYWANTGDDETCEICPWDEFDDLVQGEARAGIAFRF